MPPIPEHLGTLRDGRELLRVAAELGAEALAETAKPRWVHLLPGGTKVESRDGRKFTVSSYDDVSANSEIPMLVDWEHASESGDTRAAGWIAELKVEPDAAGDRAGLWGRVEWTDRGIADVGGRQFRYLSPVVLGRREDGAFIVEKLRSVALTNRPALKMHGIEALREQLQIVDQEQTSMDAKLRATLASAFGLKPEATDVELAEAAKPVIAAIKTGNEAGALREATATLTTELNEARTKQAELEAELATHRKAAHKQTVEAFFAEGARAGKIPPASRERWLAFALKSEDNFSAFRDTIYPGLAAVSPGRQAKGRKPPAVTARFSEQSPHGVNRAALKAMGFSEAIILQSEAEVFSQRRGPGDEAADGDEDEDEEHEGEGDENEGDENETPPEDNAGGGGAAANKGEGKNAP